MYRKLFVLIVLALLVAACGTPPPSGEALRVTEYSPANGEDNVPLDATVRVTFNQAVPESSLTAANFMLTSGTGDDVTQVAGTRTYVAATNTAVFTPDADLEPGTTYTATVSEDVAVAPGRTLPAAVSWSFTTVEADETVPPLTFEDSTPVEREFTATISEDVEAVSIPAPVLASEGQGELTWSITPINGLPPVFNVTEDPAGDAVPYALSLNTENGDITGRTGTPGVYRFRLNVSDEAEQTAYVEYVLTFDLEVEYVDPDDAFDFATQTVVHEMRAGSDDPTAEDALRVVVPGNTVRISGVPDTEWLDDAFLANMTFTIDREDVFTINARDGTISHMPGAVAGTYDVTVTATYTYGLSEESEELFVEDIYEMTIQLTDPD